jgi:hypothetical protein
LDDVNPPGERQQQPPLAPKPGAPDVMVKNPLKTAARARLDKSIAWHTPQFTGAILPFLTVL